MKYVCISFFHFKFIITKKIFHSSWNMYMPDVRPNFIKKMSQSKQNLLICSVNYSIYKQLPRSNWKLFTEFMMSNCHEVAYTIKT